MSAKVRRLWQRHGHLRICSGHLWTYANFRNDLRGSPHMSAAYARPVADISGTGGDRSYLMLSTLGKIFSRWHFDIFFLIFPRKQDLIFHISCLQCSLVSDLKNIIVGKVGFRLGFLSGDRSCLILSSLGKIFSRRHFEIFYFVFPRKQDLKFHANCLHWRQVAWNVKMKTICMKCQIMFFGKNKENYHPFAICWISSESVQAKAVV